MNKIIIDNRSSKTDIECLKYVKVVMENGRISNDDKQYSYVTTFRNDPLDIFVVTDLNKKSDRFVILDDQGF
jgi:hypothetical protein